MGLPNVDATNLQQPEGNYPTLLWTELPCGSLEGHRTKGTSQVRGTSILCRGFCTLVLFINNYFIFVVFLFKVEQCSCSPLHIAVVNVICPSVCETQVLAGCPPVL